MATAQVFGRRLTKYGKDVERGAARALGEFGATYYNTLLDRNVTPVLTGFARSRWKLTVGLNQIPALSEPPPRDETKIYPSPRFRTLELKKLQSIVLSNNAPYIELLERDRLILAKADNRTRGIFDQLLKAYAPK